MTIEELKMVNKISSYINAHTEMDFRTAYSFALAVVQNKEFIRKTLNEGTVRTMTIEGAISYYEGQAVYAKDHGYPLAGEWNGQLAAWLKILKSAQFEYHEAWRVITHPTPDVTYADRDRAKVILDTFKNSLGRME